MKSTLIPLSSSVRHDARMSLTGKPLILLAASITLLALAGTVLLWRRSGRFRLLARPAGVLLTEALLIATCGLYANRHAHFYPTWSALLADVTPHGDYTARPGALDGWLTAHPPPDGTFEWRPAGWDGWRLAHPPTVTVPAGYPERPDRIFPVVVVAGDRAPSGDTGDTGDVVVITVPVTAGTPPTVLTAALPDAAVRDLRVTGRRWALIGPPTVAGASAGRYPAVAVVGDGDVPALPDGVVLRRERTPEAALAWAITQAPPVLVPAGPEGATHGAEQSRR